MENSTELQKPNVEAEVYNNNKKCDWGKKKLKSLIRFHSANKIDSYNRGGIKGKKVQKNRHVKLNRGRQRRFIYIKD